MTSPSSRITRDRRKASPHTGSLDAALGILTRLEEDTGPPFRVRIGIAMGPLAAGMVGNAARQSYTVYGTTVSLTQRLKEANKPFGTRVLACERTASLIDRTLETSGEATIRGLEAPVRAYELR